MLDVGLELAHCSGWTSLPIAAAGWLVYVRVFGVCLVWAILFLVPVDYK